LSPIDPEFRGASRATVDDVSVAVANFQGVQPGRADVRRLAARGIYFPTAAAGQPLLPRPRIEWRQGDDRHGREAGAKQRTT
jgi:hypothetical protein